MTKRSLFFCAALCLLAAITVTAQTDTPKPVTETQSAVLTGTIVAINHDSRDVTIKGSKGNEVTIHIPEDVTRFSSMKVGDTVTATYTEGVVLSVAKPGEKAPADAATVTKREGEKPGATVARKMTADVTVMEIDAKTPAITIKTEDGRMMSYKVEVPERIKGLKVGDVIRITYTESLALNVDAPK